MEKGPVSLQEVVITPQSTAASFHTISKIDLNLQPVRSAQDILRTGARFVHWSAPGRW